MYKEFLKRIIDFIAASCCLVLLTPFLIVLFPIISFSNGGPVFFTQVRPGYMGRLFKLVKLKTMNDKRDPSGELLPDKIRITHTGKIIRSLSLDEIPQIINILKGDMSFVGPRPLLTEYMPLYNTRQARRHEVHPGITGWAQINGRNSISWEEKFEMDVWYVDNISFKLDMKILYITLSKVIKKEGINSSNTETMRKFTGS